MAARELCAARESPPGQSLRAVCNRVPGRTQPDATAQDQTGDAQTGAYLPNGAAAKAGLNKSIADAAWSVFFDVLVAKAGEAERQVIKVPPAFTTQTCADCGYR
jgi:transposase